MADGEDWQDAVSGQILGQGVAEHFAPGPCDSFEHARRAGSRAEGLPVLDMERPRTKSKARRVKSSSKLVRPKSVVGKRSKPLVAASIKERPTSSQVQQRIKDELLPRFKSELLQVPKGKLHKVSKRPATSHVRKIKKQPKEEPSRAQTGHSKTRKQKIGKKRANPWLKVEETHLNPYVGKYTPDKLKLQHVIRDLEGGVAGSKKQLRPEELQQLQGKHDENERSVKRMQAVKGLIAAAVYRKGTLLPWMASRILGPLWCAVKSTNSPNVLLLVARLIVELASTGEPWFRALIDAGALGELARWAFQPGACLNFSLVKVADDNLVTNWTWSSSLGQMNNGERDWVAAQLGHGTLDEITLEKRVFFTVRKLAFFATKYCAPTRDSCTTVRYFVRVGGFIVLSALARQQQERSDIPVFDKEWDEIIYKPWIDNGMGPDQIEESCECASKFLDARKAVQSDLKMMQALGIKPGQSRVTLLDLIAQDIKLMGKTITGCKLETSDEIADMFATAMHSYDKIHKRELFKEKCRRDWKKVMADKRAAEKRKKASAAAL